MSTLTRGDVVSRIRSKIKANNIDSGITDRTIWSWYEPWLKQVVKELDSKNKLMGFSSLFESLDIVPLIEVDRIEAGCSGLKSGYTFMRTKDPIGELFMEGYWGNMVRSITSVDQSEILQPITPSGYRILSQLKTFKFNKQLYYWYLNDYFYFPNISWKAVRIEALCEGDISQYKCDSETNCLSKQEQSLNVPDFILARAESLMFQSLGISFQLPQDLSPDGVSKTAM